MKSSLKQNWKSYLKIGIFIFIFWFFIPSQNEYYLKNDIIKISFIETLIIVGILFLISSIIFYKYFSDEKDRFIRIAKTFAHSILIGILYVFFIQNIIISIGLLTNRIYEKQEVIEKFEITEINENYGDVEFKSLDGNIYEITKGKFQNIDLSKIKEKDTISVIFKKGIFGKKYMKNAQIALKQ